MATFERHWKHFAILKSEKYLPKSTLLHDIGINTDDVGLYSNQFIGHCGVLESPMIARGSRACNRNHKPSKQRLVLIESLSRSELTTRKCRKRDWRTGFFPIEAMFAKTSLARASQNAAAVQSYQVRSARRLAGPWPGAITQGRQFLAKYSNLVSGSLMIFSMTSWNLIIYKLRSMLEIICCNVCIGHEILFALQFFPGNIFFLAKISLHTTFCIALLFLWLL